ncbi:MAG: IS1634 family transposase [Chloroflexi bacterium]|nr:IS1634 family transposase [Chloroflexota bacterium]
MRANNQDWWSSWMLWLFVAAVMILPAQPMNSQIENGSLHLEQATVAVLASEEDKDLFPWLPRWRWKKLALARYRRWQATYRKMRRRLWLARQMAGLAQIGSVNMASLVDILTRAQWRRQLGAIVVLYPLLKELRVEEIINKHLASHHQVKHGPVAMVLILSRLVAPRAMYKISDWVGRTVLEKEMGVAAAKFNDDRLGRTLDAIAPHVQEIWVEIITVAIERYQIDISIIFYDLTAFILHGAYKKSELVSYGFAHNTPSNKQKVKEALAAAADGNIPYAYRIWKGNTADKATVQENMARLLALLEKQGYSPQDMLVVGDRAMLDDKIALLYDQKELRYLAGLSAQKTVHKKLLYGLKESEFAPYIIKTRQGAKEYWLKAVSVTFSYEGKSVTHRGVAVISGPMRDQLRQSRQKQFDDLEQAFRAIQAKADAGQKRYRSAKEVTARAATQCRNSKVGNFMNAEATELDGKIKLTWQIDALKLAQAQQRDGRYLIVTNDKTLTIKQMFDTYRAKDGVEKDNRISKSDLCVSPIRLHKDDRIEAYLFINMIALLAYTILERQVKQSGLRITTRRIIEQLDELAVIETHCWDGSYLIRMTPLTQEQADLLPILTQIVGQIHLRPQQVIPAQTPIQIETIPPLLSSRAESV